MDSRLGLSSTMSTLYVRSPVVPSAPMPSSSWLCRPPPELELSAQAAEHLDVQCEQFPIDRLDEIIVRSGLEPGNLIGDHTARGDDHQHYMTRDWMVVESGQQVQPTHVG